jgi:hypothetical protein
VSGETPPFVVIQPQPPAVQLRLQYAVLFPQEFDDIALFPFELSRTTPRRSNAAEARTESTTKGTSI